MGARVRQQSLARGRVPDPAPRVQVILLLLLGPSPSALEPPQNLRPPQPVLGKGVSSVPASHSPVDDLLAVVVVVAVEAVGLQAAEHGTNVLGAEEIRNHTFSELSCKLFFLYVGRNINLSGWLSLLKL